MLPRLIDPALDASYPLSLAERDRRWAALRERMDQARVDCVVAPNHAADATGLQADARYLTGRGQAAELACVFPLHGEVTIIVKGEEGLATHSWATDCLKVDGEISAAIAARLREVPLPRRRVGVVGLGNGRSRDGTVAYGLMRALQEAHPRVQWIDFTEALREIRMVKSAEEIDLLARSTAMVDRAFQRVHEIARPRMLDYEAWGAAIGELCRLGSELPVNSLWGSGIRPTLLARPTHGELQRGHLIVGEIEAVYGGYHARGVQTLAVEACDPAVKELYALYADYWGQCLDLLTVGRTLHEVDVACRHLPNQLIGKGSRFQKANGRLATWGAGLGSDGPGFGGASRRDPTLAQTLTPGWAFLFKPALRVEVNGRPYTAVWGDTVVLDERGPRRLGTRPPGLAMTGSP